MRLIKMLVITLAAFLIGGFLLVHQQLRRPFVTASFHRSEGEVIGVWRSAGPLSQERLVGVYVARWGERDASAQWFFGELSPADIAQSSQFTAAHNIYGGDGYEIYELEYGPPRIIDVLNKRWRAAPGELEGSLITKEAFMASDFSMVARLLLSNSGKVEWNSIEQTRTSRTSAVMPEEPSDIDIVVEARPDSL